MTDGLDLIVRARLAGHPSLADEIEIDAEREKLEAELSRRRETAPRRPSGSSDAGRGFVPLHEPEVPLRVLAQRARAAKGD